MPNANVSSNSGPSSRRRKTKAKKSNSVFYGLILLSGVCVVAAVIISLSSINTGAAVEDITNPINDANIVLQEKDDGKIRDNIYVNGINIGGLTQQEASEKLNDNLNNPVLNEKLTLQYGEEKYEYLFSEFDAGFDISSAVKAAYSYGRNGVKSDGKVELDADFIYDEKALSSIIKEISQAVNKDPVDASMERIGGEFVISNEEIGFEVDLDSTIVNAYEVLSKAKSGSAVIEVLPIQPEFTAEAFKEATKLIGSYYTVISGSEANRNQNLDTAASKINDYVVYPEEVFSTNEAFGEMTVDNGYRMAPVIMGGELTNGMGGGVCQISSTLYMALLNAEVKIVERQNHSQKVGYADYGYDATLAGDYIDLKFKNDTGYPLTIESYIEGNKVFVNVYGYEVHDENRRVEFYNVHTETVPAPEEIIVENPDLPLGERDIKTSAKDGVKYDLFKIVYEGNAEIGREKINTSYYRPRAAVVHVGTGEPAQNISENPTEQKLPPSETIPASTQSESPVPQSPEPTQSPEAEPPLIEIDPNAEAPSTEAPPIIG